LDRRGNEIGGASQTSHAKHVGNVCEGRESAHD
jgi:hypothetical protein